MKLSNDEITFLDRACFKLYGNPLQWREMISSGMTHDDVFIMLAEKTKEMRQKKKNKKRRMNEHVEI